MKRTLGIALSSAALALSIMAYMVLPDMVTLQISAGGQAANTLPKLVAVLIPALLSLMGFVLSRDPEGGNVGKGMLISVIGVLAALFLLIANQ